MQCVSWRRHILLMMTEPFAGCRYLLRCSHEVDGSVVAIILLQQAKGELIIN